METIRVKKGNKEKKIDRDHLDSYLSSGYIQLDENGNEIKQVKKDNPEVAALKDELKALADENKALKKQLKELEKADKKEQ